MKTKTQSRNEASKMMAEFLANGGIVTVDTKKQKAPKVYMKGKTSKGFCTGSSGFACGFPSASFGA